MDPTVVAALIAAGGAIAGGAITAPVVAHLLGRQHARTQDDHLKAQTDLIRQDIYQQLTTDLRAELERVRASLRSTSAEAEQLRTRVVDLESRVAQLTLSEARAAGELREVQAERDRLRAELAARDATIAELRGQVNDLRLQAALTPPGAH
jgi:predicted RNase H-like nuclease (RuvC/YqgF family)